MRVGRVWVLWVVLWDIQLIFLTTGLILNISLSKWTKSLIFLVRHLCPKVGHIERISGPILSCMSDFILRVSLQFTPAPYIHLNSLKAFKFLR